MQKDFPKNYCKDYRSLSHFQPHALLSSSIQKPIKRTKIVSTIGPKCESPQSIQKLLIQGVNVARLNFSHGSHEEHLQKLNNIKQAVQKTKINIGIMLDTKGPQIRTGINSEQQPNIFLKKGQLLQITTDYNYLCNSKRISCSYKELPKSTSIGKKILFADGSISSIVTKVQQDLVEVQILNDGKLGSKKNMCLPNTIVNLPTITQKDQKDIIEFGMKYKVDFIAVSFTRYKKDLENLRQLLIKNDFQHGKKVLLISKIQNHQGIQNIDQIIQGSDGIMIARGDLGMQIPIEKVVVLQKYIMQKTINAGKFVITATQMIQSMETKPRPTRAQVSDITNAVLDLSDATMTSGQTANGEFPYETVSIMKKIIQESQTINNYQACFQLRSQNVQLFTKSFEKQIKLIDQSFKNQCDCIFVKYFEQQILYQKQLQNLIHVMKLSVLRPKAHIFVFTDSQFVKRATLLCFGVYCFPRAMFYDAKIFFKQNYSLLKKNKITLLKVKQNKEFLIQIVRLQE